MITIFLYNIFLIVLYSIAMAFSINLYIKEKRNLYLFLSLYFLFFILDNVVIYMTEFINSFATIYNQTFMNTPAIKTVIFMANCFLSLKIINELTNKKTSIFQWGLLVTTALWMIIIPLLPNSAEKVWLYYLANQLFLLYLGIHCKKMAKSPSLAETAKKYLTKLTLINILFSILIIVEDTFVIFNIDHYSSLTTKITNRSITEDIFSIVLCGLLLWYILRDLQSKEKASNLAQEETQQEQQLLKQFCQYYQFTQREEEIFELLLLHHSNQEIADQLYLSLGTVKTHVHNIYQKLAINKRNEIPACYDKFYQVHAIS